MEEYDITGFGYGLDPNMRFIIKIVYISRKYRKYRKPIL